MQKVKFFKKFLMPCGLCAAVPALKPASPPQDCPVNCCHDKESKKLIRPSELPIYTFEDYSKQIPCKTDTYSPSALEEGIGEIRRSVQSVFVEYKSLQDKVTSFVDTGVEHSQVLIDYLQEESRTLPRIGAVAMGGLSGLIFGLRGGKFKRIVYSSIGALSIAAICYPKEAKEQVNLAKHYANVGYNFIYGVTPDDNNQSKTTFLEFPDFKTPTSFSEFVNLIYTSCTSVVGSLSNTLLKTITQKEEGSSESGSKPKEE